MCFHTRLSHADVPLGTGITIQRLPRTGEIRSLSTTVDVLSLKAFMKDSVRISLTNEKFTHFLPLYFGDHKERTLYLVRKALSMISEGSTRKFEPRMIMEIMPKLLSTLVVDMMNEALHSSLKAIRMLIYFFRLFRLLLVEHPEMEKQLNEKIAAFVKNPEERHKDNTASLGDILAYVAVSSKFEWGQFVDAYLQESLDRHIFWLFKDVPELEKIEEEKAGEKIGEVDLDDNKLEAGFKGGIVSFHICLFFQAFCASVKGDKNFEVMLDTQFCRLPEDMEVKLQRACEEIRKVKSFYQYYERLGQKVPTKLEMLERLKVAAKNSREKGYHGQKEINELPEKKELVDGI